MKRKILILICLIFFIVSVSCVSAAEDVNQTVNDGADDLVVSDDTLSVSLSDDQIGAKDDGTFTALQEKINNAPEGSTISLENDYQYSGETDSQTVYISKKITINGNGFSVSGNSDFSTLSIDSTVDNVELNNINFYKGHRIISGDLNEGNLIINNCSFSAASVSGSWYCSGGAIACNNIIAKNCYFGGNRGYNPRIVSPVPCGGAVECNRGIFENCVFKENTAAAGGAISGWNLYVDSCVFINNNAVRDDGASDIYANYNLTVLNSVFLNAYNKNNLIKCDQHQNQKVDSSYFWFGNGADNYAVKPVVDADTYLDDGLTSWLFLNGTATPSQISLGKNSTIVFNFYLYDDISKKVMSFDDSRLSDLSIQLFLGSDGEEHGHVDKNFISPGEKAIYTLDSHGDSVITARCNYYSILPIKIPEISTVLEVPDVTKNYGGSERLEVTLTEIGKPIAGAKININLNGVDYPKTTDSKGKASMAINLPAGTYDATVSYGDISAVAKVTVNQLATKTALSSSKNSHNSVTLTATLNPYSATGNVVFNVNGKEYTAKVSDSKATYTLNNLAVGSYEAKATYNGDVNHKSSASGSVRFTVEEVKVDVSAPDLTKYYKGSEKFVVTVKEDNKPVVGKNVTIDLNGKPYTRTTDDNGQASMAINLNSGVYKVTSEFEGIKVDSTITVKSTVSGNNVTKIFKNGTQYYAKFVDTQGNLMKNTEVKFNINGVFYTRTTDDNGVAKMNINLPPKDEGYIITAENPDSTEKYTNVIKVLPSIVENHDLTKYYRNESKYTLRVIGDDGKPVGENVTVKLNINGVFYERKTDSSGYMVMNINLPPGEYTVTAEYNGLRASNTITVLSVLETKDLKMSYKDGSKFEAKVLDGKGKPYAGQTVTFNINGVFYQKVTGDDGVARLSINLMAGEYIITSMFNGLNAANKVTISG